MKIYAPVKDTNGVYASVRFVNGVGETTNPALVEWFRQRGYRVEYSVDTYVSENYEAPQEPIHEPTQGATEEPDFDAMTPIELRDWAKANGFGTEIKNTRSKAKLLEIIRG